jgi:hypothetical protein
MDSTKHGRLEERAGRYAGLSGLVGEKWPEPGDLVYGFTKRYPLETFCDTLGLWRGSLSGRGWF